MGVGALVKSTPGVVQVSSMRRCSPLATCWVAAAGVATLAGERRAGGTAAGLAGVHSVVLLWEDDGQRLLGGGEHCDGAYGGSWEEVRRLQRKQRWRLVGG